MMQVGEPIQLYIPSYNRPMTCRTHTLLPTEFNWKIILHNEEQKAEYLKNPTITEDRLIVTNQPAGIGYQRQWVLDQTPKDAWVIMMDDNINHFCKVSQSLYDAEELSQKIFDRYDSKTINLLCNEPISGSQMLSVIVETINEAQNRKANLAGFASTDNPFFRKKKWQDVGMIVGKIMIIRNTGISFDPELVPKEDFAFSAEHLKQHGRVLINKFARPEYTHYENGGIGSYKSREPKLREVCKIMMDRYPGLFAYKDRANSATGTQLRLRYTNTRQIAAWQEELKNGRS